MDVILDFFNYIWNSIRVILSPDSFIFSIIDILIVTYVVYKVIQFMRQTRAEQLIKGIIVFVFIFIVAQILQLNAVKWIISMISVNLLVVIVILFQPELRSILEKIGRSGLSSFSFSKVDEDQILVNNTIDEVCDAVEFMHKKKTGALIIIERKTMLTEYVDSGTLMDSTISASLINNVFFKNSPLHDGAMIIRNNRIYAASCIMPLSQKVDIDTHLGTRHRAAIGVSEICDAVVIVVSEESGNISMALNGKLKRNYTKETLKIELNDLLVPKAEKGATDNKLKSIIEKIKKNEKAKEEKKNED